LDELTAASEALRAPPRGKQKPAPLATLLVGADEPFVEQLRRSLGPADGVTVVRARDADTALEPRPAVIVASGPAGHELVRRARRFRPGVPAVIAAGDAEAPALVEAFAADPVVVLKSPAAAELALAVRALLSATASLRPQQGPASPAPGWQETEPRSYAHLAGLLPRALERAIAFDVGASVIARPGGEPLVDVYATGDCPQETLGLVRERALALFRLMSGGARDEEVESAGRPDRFHLRSSMYFPLASEGGVVGLTYLGSFRAKAFSAEDERVLAALAAHASGAYRRLEGSVHRLRLSPRQSQVLALIASGLSDKEVASRLGLAHRTVRTHVDRMLREHGLRSRTEAVAAWLRGKQG
jgi:DNA-binding NarL/FixJ family response regulator